MRGNANRLAVVTGGAADFSILTSPSSRTIPWQGPGSGFINLAVSLLKEAFKFSCFAAGRRKKINNESTRQLHAGTSCLPEI